MNIQPLHDRIIVRRAPEKEKATENNLLVIPEKLRERPNEGEVLAVGNGRLGPHGAWVNPPVNVGDIVLFGKFAGVDIEVEGEKETLLLLREEEVIAKKVKP